MNPQISAAAILFLSTRGHPLNADDHGGWWSACLQVRPHPVIIGSRYGAGKVVSEVEKSGDSKQLRAAIETLQELIGRTIAVNRGMQSQDFWPPYRIIKIDYESERDFRCVVGRIFPNGSRQYIRRSVLQAIGEHRYIDADNLVSKAEERDLLEALKNVAPPEM